MNTFSKLVSVCLSCLLTAGMLPSVSPQTVTAETGQPAAAAPASEPDETAEPAQTTTAPAAEPAAEMTDPGIKQREQITVSEPITLTDNMSLDGDITLEADINLNGHTLMVNGNLTQTAGTVLLGKPDSVLNVCGNYVLEKDGVLQMSCSGTWSDQPVCNVEGCMTVANKGGNTLEDGIITVGADFMQTEYPDNFTPNGTALSFSGVGRLHEITFADDSASYIYDLKQEPGVLLRFTNGIRIPVLRSDLTLEGDTFLSSDMNLSNHSLTVNGILLQTAGTLTLNKTDAALTVSEDWFLTDDAVLYVHIPGSNSEAPHMTVNGSLTVANNAENTLNDGTIHIGKDFVQTGYAKNFQPNGLIVSFADSGQIHSIEFAKGTESYLYDIQNENPDVRICFTKGLFLPVLHSDLTVTGDTVITSDIQLNEHTLTIDGNLTQTAGTVGLYKTGSALCVSGNYVLTENGMLDMHIPGGVFEEMNVTVGGDMTVSTAVETRLNDGIITIAGDFIQAGGGNFRPDGMLLRFTGAEKIHSLVFDDNTESYVYDIKQEPDVKIQFPNGLFIPRLHSDITVDGNTVLRSNFDANGKTLTVNGDLKQTNGVLSLCNSLTSKVQVNGSYLLTEDGKLEMNYAGADFDRPELCVTGDFTVSNNIANMLNDGTITIGGNFRQEGSAVGNNFASGATIVKFEGTKQIHDVFFDTPTSYMRNIIQEDGVKIRFTNGLSIPTLCSDLTVEDDTALNCSLDLNGHKLTVNGDLTVSDGIVSLDDLTSVLRVNGNCTIGGYGILVMSIGGATYTDPQLYVDGDLTIENASSNGLSDGTITVCGDLIQRNFLTFTKNFALNGTTLVFEGKGTHTVDSESTDTKIGKVILRDADAFALKGSLNGFADIRNADIWASDNPDVLLSVGDAVYNVTGTGTAQITVSSADSQMKMTAEVARIAEVRPTLDGDYNGDNFLTAADAALLLQFITEDGALTKTQIGKILEAKPDLNEDGRVDLLDVRALLAKLSA